MCKHTSDRLNMRKSGSPKQKYPIKKQFEICNNSVVQAYYGKVDAEAVTQYGLQCAMGSYQGKKHGGEIFMVFQQVRLQQYLNIKSKICAQS